MIHIPRRNTDQNNKLIQPNEKWFVKAQKETKKAIQEKDTHDFKDKLYGDNEIRKSLEKLFHGKCAYCEQIVLEHFDVEHFRPKGRVFERKRHLGYYLLAYEWFNLYPSCVPCNQRRREKPLWDDPKINSVGGKVDKFPIKNEKYRAMRPSHDLKKEDHYLLDPCKSEIENHFGYLQNGAIIGLTEYGKKTIEICHLYRTRLRRSRFRKINEIKKYIASIYELLNIKKMKIDSKIKKTVKKYLHESFEKEEKQFSGLSKFVINNPSTFLIKKIF